MKIKKSELIGIIREVIQEESDYRAYFKKVASEKGIDPDKIDKLSAEEKKSFFAAVDKGWKAKEEGVEETLEFQPFSKGHMGDRLKAKKRQQILVKPEVQEDKKSTKKLKLTNEDIRKMIREELSFLMFTDVPKGKSRKRAKRNSSLSGDANRP